jgi:hypothetical protein
MFQIFEQNQFNKIDRAKTPRRKEKTSYSPNLACFASLRESCFSVSTFQKPMEISNMFG